MGFLSSPAAKGEPTRELSDGRLVGEFVETIYEPIYDPPGTEEREFFTPLVPLSNQSVNFKEILDRWFELRDRCQYGLHLYLLTHYFSLPYVNQTLLFRAQAAEALHRHSTDRFTQKGWAAEEFQQMRSQIRDSVENPALRKWALDRLRNEPSFRERIIELIDFTKESVGGALVDDFPRRVRDLRDRFTHWHESGPPDEGLEIRYFSEGLGAVIECFILRELGFDEADAARLMERSRSLRLANLLRERIGE